VIESDIVINATDDEPNRVVLMPLAHPWRYHPSDHYAADTARTLQRVNGSPLIALVLLRAQQDCVLTE